MPLYRNGGFEDDPWSRWSEGQDMTENRALIFSKSDFLAHIAALEGRNAPLGLELSPGDDLRGLESHLQRVALIVLNFPKFSDGRLYSIARLLRERFGYKGEMRASGDVLRDQLAFLYRAGVDSFEVSDKSVIAALGDKTLVVSRRHYQRSSRVEPAAAGFAHAFVSPPGAIPGTSS